LATWPSVQMDLEYGAICRRTSDGHLLVIQPFQTLAEGVFICAV